MATARIGFVLLVTILCCSAAHAARPISHHGPLTVSLRDGEGLPPPKENRSKRTADLQKAAADRKSFDPQTGNNFEAASQARGCREFLATYLPQEVSFG